MLDIAVSQSCLRESHGVEGPDGSCLNIWDIPTMVVICFTCYYTKEPSLDLI